MRSNPAVSIHSTNDPDTRDAQEPERCGECGRLYHPVEAVRDLPAELESAFPIPENGQLLQPFKRRRVNPTARHMTGEQIMSQIKEKERVQAEKLAKKSKKSEVSTFKYKTYKLKYNIKLLSIHT